MTTRQLIIPSERSLLHRVTPLRSAAKLLRGCVVLGIAGCLSLMSCSPTEATYTNTDTGWSVLGTTNDNPARLSLFHEPDNLIKQNDAYANANGHGLDGPVTKIVRFDTALYVLMPSVQKIEVISLNSYKRMVSISTAPHAVVDLCFANSTTAYTANADNTVSILDITVFKLLTDRDIAVPSTPVSIAALGNAVCVCSQASSICSIIDTRTNTIRASFGTPPAPTFVGGDKTTGKFIITCLGNGKVNTTDTQSPAHLLVYSANTTTVDADITLSNTALPQEAVLPQSMYVQDGGFAYLGLNSDLSLVDTRNGVILGVLATGSFTEMAYNSHRNELAAIDNATQPGASNISVIDVSSTKVKSTTTLPNVLGTFLLP